MPHERLLRSFADIADECTVKIPDDHRLPVAIVGAGAIVEVAHLPAYAALGVEVTGVYDLDRERARVVAARNGIPVVHDTLEDLLSSGARVVDVAVTPQNSPQVVRQALAAGAHVLAQKPFATSSQEAQELADLAHARGLVVGVNQQLRYDEGLAAAKSMIERGWIGQVTHVTISVDLATPWESWPWLREEERLEVMVHSIHYHDALRWLLGEPITVYAAFGRTPGQYPRGETRTITTYTFAGGVTGLVHANHVNGTGDESAEFRISGDAGAVRGTLGLLYDYPRGRPDTLELCSAVLPTDGWVPYPVTRRWLPDAFAGPLAGVLAAAANAGKPRSPGSDNVKTLRLVESIYASARGNEVIRLEGFRKP